MSQQGIPLSISFECNGKHKIKGNGKYLDIFYINLLVFLLITFTGCVLPSPKVFPPPCFILISGPAEFEGDSEVRKGSSIKAINVILEYNGKPHSMAACRIDVKNEDFENDGINDYRIIIWPKNNIGQIPYYGSPLDHTIPH
ncbi:hypothetical protein CYY_006193 [Polysphondylium violaceum]|uniref:Uncharacterized protein n=1 Tax=Polysphondylium violaceum TaxID=133409 RepID=A0A8J4PTX0_9MYCE|nr:hypothetical protein CYY_006193 [Polysphondylium violaceum]